MEKNILQFLLKRRDVEEYLGICSEQTTDNINLLNRSPFAIFLSFLDLGQCTLEAAIPDKDNTRNISSEMEAIPHTGRETKATSSVHVNYELEKNPAT